MHVEVGLVFVLVVWVVFQVAWDVDGGLPSSRLSASDNVIFRAHARRVHTSHACMPMWDECMSPRAHLRSCLPKWDEPAWDACTPFAVALEMPSDTSWPASAGSLEARTGCNHKHPLPIHRSKIYILFIPRHRYRL